MLAKVTRKRKPKKYVRPEPTGKVLHLPSVQGYCNHCGQYVREGYLVKGKFICPDCW